LIGWGGVLLGAEAMGLPTDDIEAAIRAIDWEALVLPNGTISHGYGDTGGDASPFGWDVFGGEALWVAMFYAASTGRLPEIPLVDPTDPKTWNGSGFIDELPWVFVDSIGTDAWGVDWDAYRQDAAGTQIAYIQDYPVPAFGLSAGEPPIPSQFPVAPERDVAIPYAAYGVGGYIPAEDGSGMFIAPVVLPHYAGMVASLDPDGSWRMWDWMRSEGLVSPLNNVESLVVQQWGDALEVHPHALKGSWNLALWALGTGSALLAPQTHPLFAAAGSNEFLTEGLERITLRGLGQIDFAEVDHSAEFAAGDLVYGIETTRDGVLTVEALFDGPADGVKLVLYDQHRIQVATSSEQAAGSQRIDHQVTANETCYVKLSVSENNDNVTVRLANLLHQSDGTVTVYGTDGADSFSYAPVGSHRIVVNGVEYDFNDTDVTSVSFADQGGADTAALVGSSGNDTAEVYSDSATLDLPGVSVGVAGVEEINVDGGGGVDTAEMHSGPGADSYAARETFVLLIGEGSAFRHRLDAFSEVDFYGDAADLAKVYGSAGASDVLTAMPKEVTLGGNVSHRVMDAGEVRVFGSGDPGDEAELYDTAGAIDRFTARMRNDPDPAGGQHFATATMQGPGYMNFTEKFTTVQAFASGDVIDPDTNQFDIATLIGIPKKEGDDTYTGTPDEGRLKSAQYTYSVDTNFPRIHVVAKSGANDMASLTGTSTGKDRFRCTQVYGRLTGTRDDGTAFFHRVVRFNKVDAYGNGGTDVADFYDRAFSDTFEAELLEAGAGAWARQYNRKMDQTVHNFWNVEAHSLVGDSDTATITYGPSDTVEPPSPLPPGTDTVKVYNADYSISVEHYETINLIQRPAEGALLSSESPSADFSGSRYQSSAADLVLLALDRARSQASGAQDDSDEKEQHALDAVLETELFWAN
jgi:hypothetical protein